MESKTASRDEDQLHKLGYAQELRRGMRTFSNFAVSFTIISILSGCLTLFLFGMNTGGPAVMTLGWLFVGFFVTLVALGMAEVCFELPDRRRPVLLVGQAGPGVRPEPGAWSWFVGWFNLARPGRRHRRHRLRLALFIDAFLNLAVRRHGHADHHDPASSASCSSSTAC